MNNPSESKAVAGISFGLEDRVCVVTGGSSGIGLASARLFLRCGARVAICGRDQARLDAAAAELAAGHAPDRVFAQRCDVRNAVEIDAFAAAVEKNLGPATVLVNNAGQGRMSKFADTSDESWREELDLKFFSIIRPTRAFLPQLEQSGLGAIICVNALLAQQPEPYMVATSAARAGVFNLTHSLAIEFVPRRVRVNSILIGLVESNQWRRRHTTDAPDKTWEEYAASIARLRHIPMERLGLPAEAAQAILFLASSLSSYTTGSFIDVSGGHSRHV